MPCSAANEPYEYQQYTTLDKEPNSLGSIKWNTSTLRKCGLLPSVNFDDAFFIIPVGRALLRDFNLLVGIIPVLDDFIGRYHNKPLRRMAADEYQVRP